MAFWIKNLFQISKKTKITLLSSLSLVLILASFPIQSLAAESSQSLAYLSVETALSDLQKQKDYFSTYAASAPYKKKNGVFSDSQAKLMQDLSKAIDVIPGGVKLCLNIHY